MLDDLSDEKRVCCFQVLLALASAVILRSEFGGTHDHIYSRLPQPVGSGPSIYTPRNRVAQLYPQALGSLFNASCDTQGYGGGIRTRLHAGKLTLITST
jgi:hypothetical protein